MNRHMWLQDVLYSGVQAQAPLPKVSEDKYVALVSGLSMGDVGGETASVALLVDYLAGLLGGPKEHEQVAKVMIGSITPISAHSLTSHESEKA